MTGVVVLPQRLPPPGGSPQEVLFRRMLLQCSQRVQQQQPELSSGVKDWRTDAKFHCILESLQERLYDLQQAPADVAPDPGVLQQYQAAVRAITSQLQQPQLPTYCLRVSAQDRLAPVGAGAGAQQQPKQPQHATSSSQQPSGSDAAHQQQQQQPAQQSDTPAAATATTTKHTSSGQPTSTAAAAAGAGGSSDATAPSFSLSARAQQVLTTQARLQDELTDELLDMGQELKSSTLAMRNAIRYRGKLLDETEVSLVHSAESAKAVASKAKEQYRQGNWNLCHTCIILLSVTLIFSFMLVAIRVSSLVGLKGN